MLTRYMSVVDVQKEGRVMVDGARVVTQSPLHTAPMSTESYSLCLCSHPRNWHNHLVKDIHISRDANGNGRCRGHCSSSAKPLGQCSCNTSLVLVAHCSHCAYGNIYAYASVSSKQSLSTVALGSIACCIQAVWYHSSNSAAHITICLCAGKF